MGNPEVFNPRCQNYISAEGEIGPWGQRVLNALDNVGADCFYEDINLKTLCPKYTSFSQAKRSQFWAYVYASITMAESSCNPYAEARGVNDKATGLLAMERTARTRRSLGRDPIFCKTQKEVNPFDLTFQFECSAAILRDHSCGGNRPLMNSQSYWQRLRFNNPKIPYWIRNFPGCFR
jgi:hypothetical protein